jgi:hypothetical protein
VSFFTKGLANPFLLLTNCGRSSATWLHRKFCAAIKRREEDRLVLSGLLEMRNPHISSGGNYTRAFFKEQWKAQGVFQKEHTEAEADRRAKLVSMYKQEVVVELLRYVQQIIHCVVCEWVD